MNKNIFWWDSTDNSHFY